MKKLSLILLCIISAIFFSCSDESEKTYCRFKNYEKFLENKSLWTEPESYSFKYKFCFGDSIVLDYINVTVTDSKAQIDYSNNKLQLEDNDFFKDLFGDILFDSITEIYDYIDRYWKEQSSKKNDDKQIDFSVNFQKSEKNGYYPALFDENIFYIKHSDSDGYGGMYIKISDLKID